MSSRTLYLDHESKQITRKQWAELLDDDDYKKELRHFNNGKIDVVLKWVGQCVLMPGQPSTHAKPFEMVVHNILTTDSEGVPLPEPKLVRDVDADGRFTNMKTAVEVYEDFLVTYCGCEFVPSGLTESGTQIIEHGNKYKPISKDVPIIEDGIDTSSFGSW